MPSAFQNPYGIPANALAYGPIVGERGRDQMFGAYGNKLGPNDIAVSPNFLNQFKMGQTVQAVDAQGNPIGNYRIADTSYISPGKPTSNTVEFRDADRSNQNVFLRDLSDAPTVQVNAPAGQGIQSVPGFQGAPMSGYPDLSNASTVMVNGPGGGDQYNQYAPRTPSVYPPGMEPQQAQNVSPFQHALNVLASNFAQQQNMNAFAQADWNRGGWTANPTGGEGPPQGDARHNIGALAAKLGLMGRSGGGRLPVMFQ